MVVANVWKHFFQILENFVPAAARGFQGLEKLGSKVPNLGKPLCLSGLCGEKSSKHWKKLHDTTSHICDIVGREEKELHGGEESSRLH